MAASRCGIASISGIADLYPCFYGGGGSCAFDRRKFLELGGFDELLAPFYLEDTDLGYMAWKRGWKVLYQPRSIVYHEHRGTIGKRFTDSQIQAVLKKNYLLFCWKNIHDWRLLAPHFFFSYGGALLSLATGDVPGRANLDGWWRAFRQLPRAIAITLAGAQPGRGGRCGSVPQAVRGIFPGPILGRQAGSLSHLTRAVRFAVSHLSARPRRRCVHVSNAAGTGQARDGARGGHVGPAIAGCPRRRSCAVSARRLNSWCARPYKRAWVPCGRMRSPSSPTTIWTGSFTDRSICTRSTWCSSNTRRSANTRARIATFPPSCSSTISISNPSRAASRTHARHARPDQGALRVSAGAAL
jgi:hypothetical protein